MKDHTDGGEANEVLKTNSSIRFTVTCIKRLGITQYLSDKPKWNCPICLASCNSTYSCMSVLEWVQEIQHNNNFFGGPKKIHTKTRAGTQRKNIEACSN